MKIQWLGTAGFRIESGKNTFLMDPYLSRNQKAFPHQPLNPENLAPASHIFISHGHFDHIQNVPDIARVTNAKVCCCPVAAKTLVSMGLDSGQIQIVRENGWETKGAGIQAKAFYSSHVRFDVRLLLTTLARVNIRLPGIWPLFYDFPCGQVLSWQFLVEGQTIQFFGSAGSSVQELEQIGKRSIDILLVPLQGHSRICEIAARYVQQLSPKLVIPHHWDDFFPPISKTVDISSFLGWVEQFCPNSRVQILEINQPLFLEPRAQKNLT